MKCVGQFHKTVAVFLYSIVDVVCLVSGLLHMCAWNAHDEGPSPSFYLSNIKMTSSSCLTDEAELAMFYSSLEDIQSSFAALQISIFIWRQIITPRVYR